MPAQSSTPPEGPALGRDRDTTIDQPKRRRGPSVGLEHTATPVEGSTTMNFVRPSKPKTLEPGVMVGEYKIEGLLGEGGMGCVYAAIHPVIGKRAAIKVLHPKMSANAEVVERFIQEAAVVNQIGHPNIVDIFSFSTFPDGTHYFVMELLKGEGLHERIRRDKLTREELCNYVRDICHALEAAHEQGIIHRDLKPDNVFLQQVKGRIQVKLLDFGIAKLAASEDNRLERTRTGAMMGTPKYIAPEQARGYTVDHRVDVYSLGVMLFELVAGRLPFEADNAMDLVASHLHDVPPRLGTLALNVPMILDDIVDAMLAKEAERRPTLAQVREVLEELRSLPGGDVAYTIPDMRAYQSQPRIETPSHKRLFVFAGVGVAAAIVGTFFFVRSMKSDDTPVVTIIEQKGTEPRPKPPDPIPEPVQKKLIPLEPAKLMVTIKKGMLGGVLVIDGKEQRGKGPWEIELEPGSYEIVLKALDGSGKPLRNREHKETITLESGQTLSRELGFAPPGRPFVKPEKPNKPTGSSEDDFMSPTRPKKL
jgi:serine/threonine protein kinase